MNCPKCGKKIDDGASFCTSCGSSTESDGVTANTTEKQKNSNKKAIGLAIGCFVAVLIIVAAVIIAIVAFVSSIIKNVTETEELDMGFNTVPSVYKLLGEQKVCSFSSSINSGNKEYEITYCNTSDKDLNKYFDMLIRDYGFREVDGTTFNREVILDDKSGSLKVIHVIKKDDVITYKVE